MPDDNPQDDNYATAWVHENRRRTYRYFGQQLDQVFAQDGIDRDALIRLRVRWLAESLRG